MTAIPFHSAAPPSVRGACPGLSTPMPTGDGLLARMGFDAAISVEHLMRIATLAKRYGNGLIDISARGNLQLRGLTTESAQALENDLGGMNLPLREGVPVETGALSGRDPAEIANAEPLASAIRAVLREDKLSGRFAAKFTIVVDGGGQLPLHALLADIRLQATRRANALYWQIFLGGTATTGRSVGRVRDADAKSCVASILARLVAMTPPPRGRDLDPEQVRAWLGDAVSDKPAETVGSTVPAFGLLPITACPATPLSRPATLRGTETCDRRLEDGRATRPPPPSTHDPAFGGSAAAPENSLASKQKAGGEIRTPPIREDDAPFAVRIGIPFGQCHADTLIALARRAEDFGVKFVRPASDHSLVFFANESACRNLMAFSKDLILSPHDPRARIAACPGKPACMSASLNTHALGETTARQAADLLDGSFTLHLSGCSKGCAHPTASLLGLVGTNEGTALIFRGKTSDMPLKFIRHGQEERAISVLAALVRLERGIGETTSACLSRLGPARLEQVLSQGLS
ncbi:precorrin-3B synthase [Neorhizobium sp. NPDC001467]|uniref:precorrin-3B synthase n=1 Tax=Neorhizobium sp. NPDC001467 TaxID=3390595 RepID=UPI003CFD32B1